MNRSCKSLSSSWDRDICIIKMMRMDHALLQQALVAVSDRYYIT